MSLRPYQVKHYETLLNTLLRRGSALDASDGGLGKTYVALHICKALGITPLVVGPKTAQGGWYKASQQVGVELEYVGYEKLRGRRKVDPAEEVRYQKKFAEWSCEYQTAQNQDGWDAEKHDQLMARKPEPPRALTETDFIEEVSWGKGSFLKWKQNYVLIILDEVHRCGGAKSLNSKVLIAAKRQAQYVLALSATAADDPRQMKALGYVLGLHGMSKKSRTTSDYMGWLLRHGVTPGDFGGFEFSTDPEKREKAFKRLHAEIFPAHGSRMRKADIPNFPKTVVDVRWIEDETGKAVKLAEQLHATPSGLDEAQKLRQKLENLKVPFFVDFTLDVAHKSKVVIFVNYTEPLLRTVEALKKEFGNTKVGIVYGQQTAAERAQNLDDFQANKFDAMVCNIQAGGESANMHDPTGGVERTTFISPCESGRQFQQVLYRVNRDGGAFSQQYVTLFRGTHEETVGNRVLAKVDNITLLNDGDLKI